MSRTVKDYVTAFDADIVNLLVGPLAEAKHAILEQKQFNQHRLTNFFQSMILLGSMLFLLALISYLLTGLEGLKWMVMISIALLPIVIKFSPDIILNLYRAKPMSHNEIPGLQKLVSELAESAKLGAVPQLYYVSSRTMPWRTKY